MKRNFGFIILILILTISCTPKISPTHYDIQDGTIEPLESSMPIRIIAKKVEKPEYKVPGGYPGQEAQCMTIADINEMNTKVATLIETELAKNGIAVSDTAKKTITIDFQSGNWKILEGVWSTEYDLYLRFKVETAHGYQKEFKIVGATYVDYNRALGDALTNTAEDILSDQKIREYIEDGPVSDDVAGKLEKLKNLADRGLITKEEYKQRKDEILDKMLDQQ